MTALGRRRAIGATPAFMVCVVLLRWLTLPGLEEDAARQAFDRGDYATSIAAYAARAAAGEVAAQNFLGLHYYLGLAGTRDAVQAARWFERAARAGDADAARNLAVLYEQGLGVGQDLVRAWMWYHVARLRGNERAQSAIDALVAQHLTPDQLALARRMAEEIIESTPR